MITIQRTNMSTDSAQIRLLGTAYRNWHQALSTRAWEGRTGSDWLPMSLPPKHANDEKELLEEYHMLVDLDRLVELTPAQSDRLQIVEQELDALDAATPGAQWMAARMSETSDKLDALLQVVCDLAARRVPG